MGDVVKLVCLLLQCVCSHLNNVLTLFFCGGRLGCRFHAGTEKFCHIGFSAVVSSYKGRIKSGVSVGRPRRRSFSGGKKREFGSHLFWTNSFY